MEDTGPRRIPSLKPSASPTPPETIRNEGSSMRDFEVLKEQAEDPATIGVQISN